MTSMTTIFYHDASEIAATWVLSAALLFGIEFATAIGDEYKSTLYSKTESVSIAAALHVGQKFVKPSAFLYILGALLAFGLTVQNGRGEDELVSYFLYLIYDIIVGVFVLLTILKLKATIHEDSSELSASEPGKDCTQTQDDKVMEKNEASRRRNSPIQRS